jgi:hypothetical protein
VILKRVQGEKTTLNELRQWDLGNDKYCLPTKLLGSSSVSLAIYSLTQECEQWIGLKTEWISK